MVWFGPKGSEFKTINEVEEVMELKVEEVMELMTRVGIELLGQLKSRSASFFEQWRSVIVA